MEETYVDQYINSNNQALSEDKKFAFGKWKFLIIVAVIMVLIFSVFLLTKSNTITNLGQNNAEKFKIGQKLISREKTIKDVKGYILDTTEIKSPINVSTQLQAEFQKAYPGQKILYIGPDNRGDENNLTGNELNDSIVTVGGTLLGDKDLTFLTFGGIKKIMTENGKIFYSQIAMKFIDIILIPNSKDFYVHGIDPLSNNADIYVRIVRDENSKFQQTELQCFNLNNKDGFDYGKSKNYDKKKHLASNIQPDKFFIPGDTLEFFTQFSVVQTGNTGVMTFSADEKGVQTAALAGDIRLAGADEIESLFQ